MKPNSAYFPVVFRGLHDILAREGAHFVPHNARGTPTLGLTTAATGSQVFPLSRESPFILFGEDIPNREKLKPLISQLNELLRSHATIVILLTHLTEAHTILMEVGGAQAGAVEMYPFEEWERKVSLNPLTPSALNF